MYECELCVPVCAVEVKWYVFLSHLCPALGAKSWLQSPAAGRGWSVHHPIPIPALGMSRSCHGHVTVKNVIAGYCMWKADTRWHKYHKISQVCSELTGLSKHFIMQKEVITVNLLILKVKTIGCGITSSWCKASLIRGRLQLPVSPSFKFQNLPSGWEDVGISDHKPANQSDSEHSKSEKTIVQCRSFLCACGTP